MNKSLDVAHTFLLRVIHFSNPWDRYLLKSAVVVAQPITVIGQTGREPDSCLPCAFLITCLPPSLPPFLHTHTLLCLSTYKLVWSIRLRGNRLGKYQQGKKTVLSLTLV